MSGDIQCNVGTWLLTVSGTVALRVEDDDFCDLCLA